MKNKFAIRLKKTGEFLSTRSSVRSRSFGHVDDAHLWNSIGHAKLALYHVKEVQEWMKKNKRHHISNYMMQDMPVEIVEFNVILIDSKKGYIG